jgi:hypothetical protein
MPQLICRNFFQYPPVARILQTGSNLAVNMMFGDFIGLSG